MADPTTTSAKPLDLPVWCTEVDLGRPPVVVPTAPPGAATVRVLVRWRGEPLGYVETAARPLTVDDVVALLPPSAREGLRRDVSPDGPTGGDLAAVPPAERVTVVVCTRERADVLGACLDGLARLTYPALEILVVDNAPGGPATRDVVEAAAARDLRVRYTVEPRPGLSHARNRGLAEATGDVVAYTDDDVRVDPLWVHGIVRGFSRREDVACVTGLAAAAALHSEVEAYFDSRVSWATLRPAHVYDLGEGRDAGPLYPFAAGLFGTGANVAFRRSVMLALGGFDPALGAGAATRGGEDLDAFVRVLLGGYALAFEPAAIVWHHHRADLDGLRRQMYGYGTGLSAFYAKLLADPATRGDLLRVLPHGLLKLVRTLRSTSAPAAAAPAGSGTVTTRVSSRDLLLREVAGMAAGPALYWRARRTAGRR